MSDVRLDSGFLFRVQRGALALFLVALLVSLQQASLAVSLGLFCGYALGAAILWSWQVVARRAFDPAKPRPGLAGIFFLLKLPLVGAAVWLLISKDLVHPMWFAGGFTIPQVVVGLFAVAGRGARGPVTEDRTRVATRA